MRKNMTMKLITSMALLYSTPKNLIDYLFKFFMLKYKILDLFLMTRC